jgi:Excreted virulence factor EspC, type VII ESX diderm
MAELNVDVADLARFAGTYDELSARAKLISPQAATEVQRIAETHGPMGYPAAVGIATGLANAEGPLNAKVADFQTYSQRFTEHAATYTGQDSDGAQRIRSADFKTDTPRTPGSGGAAPVDWNPGDPRHRPYIAGPGGLGPSNTPDGPPWVEVGPGSGNFVRSDELPGMQTLAPGALGPAQFFDKSGNAHSWIEMGPHTGVWVPDTDFPGAKFYPPGSNALPPAGWDEYLPGSGIFLWHGDLKPEPLQPGSGGATHPA